MSPRVLLSGSLAFSMLFNLVWATRAGVHTPADLLSIGAAVACTLIVPAGLGLWPQIPAKGFWARAFRALLMLGISAAAAITSFAHSVEVLIGTGWSYWTAAAVTAGIELLVALSTMALRQPVRTEQEQVDEQREQSVRTDDEPADGQAETEPEQVADTPPVQDRKPVRKPSRKLSAVKTDHADDFLKWALELDERPSTYAVRQRFQCGHDKALALLTELDRVAGSEAVS